MIRVFVAAVVALALLSSAASAHPLGNFSVNHQSRVSVSSTVMSVFTSEMYLASRAGVPKAAVDHSTLAPSTAGMTASTIVRPFAAARRRISPGAMVSRCGLPGTSTTTAALGATGRGSAAAARPGRTASGMPNSSVAEKTPGPVRIAE